MIHFMFKYFDKIVRVLFVLNVYKAAVRIYEITSAIGGGYDPELLSLYMFAINILNLVILYSWMKE